MLMIDQRSLLKQEPLNLVLIIMRCVITGLGKTAYKADQTGGIEPNNIMIDQG
jgi:hypothetical protein